MNANGDTQHPLAGVVLCGTALTHDDRVDLASIGPELGAAHKLDLTTDVTHLLVGNIVSEKYCHTARHRPDIQVLRPQWLRAVRDAWIQGGDIDLTAITNEYRLPTFSGLSICLTGFEDPSQRQWVQMATTENGGVYHGDLTRKVSHLVVAKPTGAKYDRAREWKIHTVSLQWFEACIKRGMVLDESLFDPLLPTAEQGKGAFVPIGKRTGAVKRPRESGTDLSGPNAKRKLRRTASTRLNSQSQGMLETLADANPHSFNDSVTAVDHSFDISDKSPAPTVDTQPTTIKPEHSSPPAGNSKLNFAPKALFSGWTCLPHGHTGAVSSRLRQFLVENGASVVEAPENLANCAPNWPILIVPTLWMADSSAIMPDVPEGTKIVTEWWVERCIMHRRVLDPDRDIFSHSLHDLPKDCFRGYTIGTSGFGQDLRYIAKIIKAAGGNLEEDVTRKVNLLIYNPSNDLEKPAYCTERQIDVVTPEWLYKSIRQREPEPPHSYYLPRHICDAIRGIIKERQSALELQAEDDSKTYEKKPTAIRLSGARRAAGPPSLTLTTRAIEQIKHDRRQSPVMARPLEESLHDSQETLNIPLQPDVDGDKSKEMNKENRSPEAIEPADELPKERTMIRTTQDVVNVETLDLMSELLSRRGRSSSIVPEETDRRKRKLGRAASSSTTASFTRQATNPFIEEPEEEPSQAPLPSQQLSYDVPVSEDHRRFIGRKMGIKFDTAGHGERVQTQGTVRDVEPIRAGVGGRVRGRHRDQHQR